MKNLIITIIVCAFSLTIANAGGPWPQKKGKGFFKLSEWWTVFDEHYNDNGLIDPNVTTGIFNTTLYGEYGISDRFTLTTNSVIFSRTYMNNIVSNTTDEILVPGEALNSIGDIMIGAKYSFNTKGSIPLGVALELGIPTGESAGGTFENLQTGDGEFNQLITFSAGKSFLLGKSDAFVSAYTAFNNRTTGFSDEFRWGIEAGTKLANNKLLAIGRINQIISMNNGDRGQQVTSTSIFSNNSEFISLEAELSYFVGDNYGISAGVGSVVSGNIIAAAPSYNVGVFIKI